MNKGKEKPPEGYCVCCPGCGRMFQRSIETVSNIHCQKCSTEFSVFLKDKAMLINVDTGNEGFAERAHKMLEMLAAM